MKRTLRILLVEDDRERRNRLLELWKATFSVAGTDAKIEFLESFDDVEAALKQRPHIAIFDNVFVDSEIPKKGQKHAREFDNVGIDQISRLKPDHNDTVFALYTAATFVIDQLGVRIPNPDFLITKTYLSNAEYRAYLGKTLSSAVTRFPFGELSFHEPRDLAIYKDVMPELRSVIEQCLFGFWDSELDDEPIAVRLHPLTGGLSGSSVFRLEFFGTSRYENIPFVLKFSARRNVSAEAARYNAFVRLQLPHDMRVDLIGYGEAGQWAGACYAFAFGHAAGVTTVTNALRAGNVQAVSSVIERILTSEHTRWYRSSDAAPERLEDFFSNSMEYAPSKDSRRLEGFKAALEEIADLGEVRSSVTADLFRYGELEYPSLRRSLARTAKDEVGRCFGHGDLNSNNIFIEPVGHNLALIDFEYAGLDNRYKDFISFESSVRLEFDSGDTDDIELFELVSLEEAALSNDLDQSITLPSYLQQVIRVRAAASERYGKPIGLSYYFGLGFHTMKLLGLPVWNGVQKTRLCAAMLATSGVAARLVEDE